MEDKDIQRLVEWVKANKDHQLGFIEKEAVKLALKKAKTVGDLLNTAISLLGK